MKCAEAASRLSPLLDQVLPEDQVSGVQSHLQRCAGCREEFARLEILRSKLGDLGAVETPAYLRRLLSVRMSAAERNSWRNTVRDGLDSIWSGIRSTEGIWYWTRALGTATTFVLFFALYTAVSPIGVTDVAAPNEQASGAKSLQHQVVAGVQRIFGLVPLDAQRRPISPTDPMINELYLLNFGQSTSRTARDDSVSVIAAVDSRGAVAIRDILEYPADADLLADFSMMIASARYRPASQNGRAVDSLLVLSFSKISVYD